jgi:hypothetical protein
MQKLLLIGLMPLFLLPAAQARTESGRDIVERSQVVHFAYKTLKASGDMTLRRGSEAIGQRAISVELIERGPADAYDQARVSINAPSALKDTRLISWSADKGDDQQWLITPRTRRVQRIADRGRLAAFVSSDFSYEDILKWQLEDYDYTRAGEGSCPGTACFVVDAKPRNRYSNYALLKLYFDDKYRLNKVDYFVDRVDSPRKTLIHSGYSQYGETWQPSNSRMTDHERETSTEIAWSGYTVNAPIDERVMSAGATDR